MAQTNGASESTAAAPAPVLRPKLSELAARISENAKIVEDYIESQGLPYPSFAPDAPSKFPLPPASTPELEKIHAARQEVLTASRDIYDLSAGPNELLQWVVWGFNDTSTMHVINHFRIPHLVPDDGDISYEELAKKVNISPMKLRQVLRYAMTNRMFCETRQGHVGHTALSVLLRDDHFMQAWIGYNTEDLPHTAYTLANCLEKYPNSGEIEETPWALAFGGRAFFQFMDDHPEKAKRFGVSMSLYSSADGLRVAPLVSGYDWKKLPEGATIVDVGGATGFVSVEIAKANPSFKFIVEDVAPLSLEEGKARLEPDLAPRFQFLHHDFLTEQPIKGADAYMIRWCLHNWSDKYACQVLKALVPALKNGAKIIVNEFILPPANVLNPWDERRVRALDLVMLKAFNSNEREEADWKRLFADADPRYRFDSITRPPNSLLSILEATFVDE